MVRITGKLGVESINCVSHQFREQALRFAEPGANRMVLRYRSRLSPQLWFPVRLDGEMALVAGLQVSDVAGAS